MHTLRAHRTAISCLIVAAIAGCGSDRATKPAAKPAPRPAAAPATAPAPAAPTPATAPSPAAQPAATAEGADSPAECVRLMGEAMKAGRWADQVSLMHPDERIWVVGHHAFGLTMMARAARGEAGVEKVQAMWKRHGATLPANVDELAMSGDMDQIKAASAMALAGVKLAAFFGDVWKLMMELDPAMAGGLPADMPPMAATDVVIDGDEATANVMGEPMRFSRVAGRWYGRQKPGE